MTAVLNTIILALIGLSVLAALFFILKGVRSRSQSAREAYGVGQQEARRSMRIDLVRSVTFLVVGLILLGVYGLSTQADEGAVDPTATAVPLIIASPSSEASDTPLPVSPTATTAVQASTRQPTDVPPTATATAVPEPTEDVAVTAVVISEVGVWLRGTPGIEGDQLEWVLGGTELTLLSGLETADDFQWQQVRTPTGNEGWVAIDYIEVNN